jgi:predicted HicB family RNase H-like nuclease
MTKSIRISEKVHTKLKIFVAKRKISIIDFADTAITNAIKESNAKKQKSSNESNAD